MFMSERKWICRYQNNVTRLKVLKYIITKVDFIFLFLCVYAGRNQKRMLDALEMWVLKAYLVSFRRQQALLIREPSLQCLEIDF